jgi:hypothetical protein
VTEAIWRGEVAGKSILVDGAASGVPGNGSTSRFRADEAAPRDGTALPAGAASPTAAGAAPAAPTDPAIKTAVIA